MKAIKISEDRIDCLREEAIFYDDDSFVSISGDWNNGFSFGSKESIENILDNEWGELISILESENKEFVALAGETIWSGTGFVAVKYKKTNSFKWIIHSSRLSSPFFIQIERGNFIRLITDLNWPDGIDFVIPIERPEKLEIELPYQKK